MTGTARDYCLAPERVDAPIEAGARYGRMFDLPPLDADESLLHALGAVGGYCDGGDTEADSNVEAGWPFFGQYVAHDLTADRSPLRAHADLAALRNMRMPRANLESLFGGGPVGSPYMYRRDDPATLLDDGEDLPRNQEGIALIGDPRNDVHVFVGQMQLAFIRAHNRLVDRLREDGTAEADVFDRARHSLAWHYQWLIVNEYLPGLVGRTLVHDILTEGPRFYAPDEPFIPIEFADAAFRYGHSQIRQRYQLRHGGPRYAVFPDLMGFGPIGDRIVDWSLLFDVSGRAAAQRAKVMDGALPQALIQLPQAITGAVDEEAFHSLAARDLVRGQGTDLPSGEAVARIMGVGPLTADEVGLRAQGWTAQTPLWIYILRESFVRHAGDRLGDVGGRIVAEVLLGIIRGDPEAYLRVAPDWTPTLPARDGTFRLVDILVPAR
ncbi:MAG TPA: peroxidase family protein [Candidatus Limnocylindrales bacterium]